MTPLCQCLEDASDNNYRLVIDQLLREGREDAAFHIFLAAASNLKAPQKKETLVALLDKIDSAAGLAPIDESSGLVLAEFELVHKTSIKLENALSRFAEPNDKMFGVVRLHANARRVLRLYHMYGEPTSRSQTAQEIGVQKPDLCLKHIRFTSQTA